MSTEVYPPTPERPVVDVMHGVTVVDPYRWLEDGEAPETRAWLDRQNALTEHTLGALSLRSEIRDRWLQLAQAGSVGGPRWVGPYLYYQERQGSENQPVLMRSREGTGDPEVVLDPNLQHASGLVSLDWYQPSRDGRWLLYGYSASGDEWSTLYGRDLSTGADLDLAIPRARMASVAWLPDGASFFYTRYPLVGSVPDDELSYHSRVYYHRMGTDFRQDPVVFGEGRDRRDIPHVDITEDGRFLVVTIFMGWTRSDVFWADLEHEGAVVFQPLVTGLDGLFEAVPEGHALYLMTNWQAPNWRVLRVDLDGDDVDFADAVEVVPEREHEALQEGALVEGGLLLHYLQDARSRLVVYHPATGGETAVRLPELGSVVQLAARADRPYAYVSYQSFGLRPGIWAVDVRTGDMGPYRMVEETVASKPVTVTQEWCRSQDGTAIPVFVVRRSDLGPGPHPTILSGYGGFNVSNTPTYAHDVRVWVEMGGVYALATLRGGAEYGERWHRAGMLEQKQHVFDDFLAAAEHLIEAGHTDTAHLAIWGRSNGGLLVGAALTQRPDLFQAVACGVPLLDMLRYQRFLIADLWTAEYGSAEVAEQFPYLYAYSPYHHVTPGTLYPAVLLYAAHSDSRVDPLHARKMAALLQASTGSDRPVLLREEFDAGHGVGKPVAKQVDEYADILAFLGWQTGLGAS